MKLWSKIFLLGVILLSAGCATTETAPIPTDANISSIALDSDISKPELSYIGNSLSFGIIGVLAAGNKKQLEWEAVASDNNIEITEIVRSAFEHALEISGRFPIEDDANHSLRLEILSYGLSVPNGLSNKLFPTLLVRAKIVDADEQPIWQTVESYDIFNKVEKPIEKEKIAQDPEILRQMWTMAAQEVAKIAISKF